VNTCGVQRRSPQADTTRQPASRVSSDYQISRPRPVVAKCAIRAFSPTTQRKETHTRSDLVGGRSGDIIAPAKQHIPSCSDEERQLFTTSGSETEDFLEDDQSVPRCRATTTGEASLPAQTASTDLLPAEDERVGSTGNLAKAQEPTCFQLSRPGGRRRGPSSCARFPRGCGAGA
jgi:hypothetical protein